jgi:hypothetical protein
MCISLSQWYWQELPRLLLNKNVVRSLCEDVFVDSYGKAPLLREMKLNSLSYYDDGRF